MSQSWKGMPIVGLYTADLKGGFVQIVEVTTELGTRFDAEWSNDLHYWILVGGGAAHMLVKPYTLDDLVAWLKTWDPTLTEVADMGEQVLFYRVTTKGRYTISLDHDEFNGFKDQIKASEVPVDSILLSAAAHFFRYYKGEKAVQRRGDVVYLAK